ncbi:MAG: rRNA pseudouridine synthase [Clostridia bacterium]|nr:rRNA pseudouridine synthase [Clostridia bacterium]
MRLDKLLSECGVLSRRESAAAAKRGQITVDGVPQKDASVHIDPERQTVAYMGRRVEYHRFTYIMLNKPAGYVSATEDSRLPVVTELLEGELKNIELFPVGRLDRDTVGMMILTNNGPLAHSLLSPKHHVEKVYRFECAEPLVLGAEERFLSNITLADGYECKSAKLIMDEGRLSGYITLTEGKYHQIKRMIAALGNRVSFLERISFAGIPLDKGLARGEYRRLTPEEERYLESLGN